MKFTITTSQPQKVKADLLAVLVWADKKQVAQSIKSFTPSLKKEVLTLADKSKFKGKAKDTLIVSTHGKISSPLIVLVGLGKQKSSNDEKLENLREAVSLVQQTATKYQSAKIGLILPDNAYADISAEKVGEAVAIGSSVSEYKFKKYKKPKKKIPVRIKEMMIVSRRQKLMQGCQSGQLISQGVMLARDLINESPGQMRPADLLKAARAIAQKSAAITIKSFNRAQLKRLGCGGILAVSQGSPHEPYLIHLTYKPRAKSAKKIALVGKGITFDSGGLNLKPGDYMGNMKTDMAGAATVLGVFSTLSALKPRTEIHGLIATCENMPGSKAIKPGDVIKIKNGKTVEINNTDAEGRIVLADALSYITEKKVSQIIDLATLTGACVVALGDDIAGVMGNNQKLIDRILSAGKSTGEDMWELPLPKKYQKLIESDVAELSNLSKSKSGGAITAGLFLKQFVGKTPWVHLDIAGPAWAEKPVNAYTGKGAVGFGVRTMIEFLLNI